MVPDYNEYEDDYLKQVLVEENGGAAVESQAGGQRTGGLHTDASGGAHPQEEHGKKPKKKQRRIVIIIAMIVCLLILVLLVLGAVIRSNHDNSFSYQVEQAEKAQEDGDTDKAISYYENALALDEGSVEVRLALASLYLEKHDFDAALVLYQEVLGLDRKNREAAERMIDIYEEQGNTEAVLALYEAVDDSLEDLFAEYMVTVPEFDLEEGTFDEEQELSLSSEDGFDIYYTLDGGDPTLQGIHYTEPIKLDENEKTYVVKAACVNRKQIYSDVVEREYRIEFEAPDMPIVTPDGGDFGVAATVTVTVPDGCTAYYTWSGATPNKNSNRYTKPITIPEGNNVLSVILLDNKTGLYSEVYRGNYVYYEEDFSGENVEDE
jgi:tetratricopeptide (TPR) repeat protein